ncbi:hypothetical protein B0H11DRAFT_2183350 [Mycena galericulata]|nr:hypothetical protein B0H11DRAFT_2183350 [Mycena galericulata]
MELRLERMNKTDVTLKPGLGGEWLLTCVMTIWVKIYSRHGKQGQGKNRAWPWLDLSSHYGGENKAKKAGGSATRRTGNNPATPVRSWRPPGKSLSARGDDKARDRKEGFLGPGGALIHKQGINVDRENKLWPAGTAKGPNVVGPSNPAGTLHDVRVDDTLHASRNLRAENSPEKISTEDYPSLIYCKPNLELLQNGETLTEGKRRA